MEEFQKRMLNEYDELEGRLAKLNAALGKNGFREKVGDRQYELTKQQAEGMKIYFQALSKRLVDMGLLHMDAGN